MNQRCLASKDRLKKLEEKFRNIVAGRPAPLRLQHKGIGSGRIYEASPPTRGGGSCSAEGPTYGPVLAWMSWTPKRVPDLRYADVKKMTLPG